jgi:hypothetical protein
MDALLREMFSSLACAVAMRVKDGIFFFRGLYSGRDAKGEVFFGLLGFLGASTSGRVKITVFSVGFTSFMLQPMLFQALARTEVLFVHHSGFLCAEAGSSLPIIPSISENCSLTHLVHLAFLDKYMVRGVYFPLNACLGDTYFLAQFRQTKYSPVRRSSVMQLLQNSCLHRGQRVSCEGGTVRLHRLHWLFGGGGRVPPIGTILSRTELNA